MINVVIELKISGLRETDVPQPESIEEPAEAADDVLSDSFEDLFEDDATPYTTCRLAVARAQDTYASIAARYHVDETALRACNHDRVLQEKSLVLLP